MVRLRLFNCVKDFLEGGTGDKYFGENARRSDEPQNGLSSEPHLFLWPRDGNKIVSLVTPLLRRMVTNERQRMYAIVTRKGGSGVKKRRGTSLGPDDEFSEVATFDTSNLGPLQLEKNGTGNGEHIGAEQISDGLDGLRSVDPALYSSAQAFSETHVQVYVMRQTTSLLSRFTLPRTGAQIVSLEQVREASQTQLADILSFRLLDESERPVVSPRGTDLRQETTSPHLPSQVQAHTDWETHIESISVHLPNGLTIIRSEDDWAQAIQEVSKTVWLEGVARVVVQMR